MSYRVEERTVMFLQNNRLYNLLKRDGGEKVEHQLSLITPKGLFKEINFNENGRLQLVLLDMEPFDTDDNHILDINTFAV